MEQFYEELINQNPLVKTGVKIFDSLIGGLAPGTKGELITITGETNSGRNLLLLAIMKNLLMNGHRLIYFCNPNNRIPELMWGSALGYRYRNWDYDLIERLKSNETIYEHQEEFDNLFKLPLSLELNDYDISTIINKIIIEKREKDTNYVFIEDVQNIKDYNAKSKIKIVKTLKNLVSHVTGITIILTSMLSESFYLRKNNNTCPILSDLGLIGHLDEYSDIVLSVHNAYENDMVERKNLYIHNSWELNLYLDVLKNYRGRLKRGIMTINSEDQLLYIGTNDEKFFCEDILETI